MGAVAWPISGETGRPTSPKRGLPSKSARPPVRPAVGSHTRTGYCLSLQSRFARTRNFLRLPPIAWGSRQNHHSVAPKSPAIRPRAGSSLLVGRVVTLRRWRGEPVKRAACKKPGIWKRAWRGHANPGGFRTRQFEPVLSRVSSELLAYGGDDHESNWNDRWSEDLHRKPPFE